MMSLANRVEHYLAVRRRFGSDLSTGKRELRQFAAFADTEDAAWITVDLFLRWKQRFGSAGNATWSLRLGLVRGFAKWLHGIDPRTEIPPAGLIPAKMRRPRPYIYTDNEIVSIVTQAARLSSTRGLRGLNFSTLFGVLAVTGLRVSEAVGLDDRDVDLDNAVLEVRNGKNRNSRIIPITACTAQRLGALRAARSRVLGIGAIPFFINESGRRLTTVNCRYNFAQVCHQIGLRERQASGGLGYGPRLHDLRHTMAVKTILDWYRTGRDPGREMHKLSTYLGHVRPENTYWYMEAVPELLQLACERAERNLTTGEGR